MTCQTCATHIVRADKERERRLDLERRFDYRIRHSDVVDAANVLAYEMAGDSLEVRNLRHALSHLLLVVQAQRAELEMGSRPEVPDDG